MTSRHMLKFENLFEMYKGLGDMQDQLYENQFNVPKKNIKEFSELGIKMDAIWEDITLIFK